MRCATALALATALLVGRAGAGEGTATPVEVRSPDGQIAVILILGDDGAPGYAVRYRGEPLIAASRLGLRFQAQAHFDQGFSMSRAVASHHDGHWEQPWGERRVVEDRYTELLATYTATAPPRSFDLRVRVYDDGLGLRYEVPAQPGYEQVNIVDELTEFSLPAAATVWWIPGRGWNRYEYLYRTTGIEAVDRAHTPMTLRLPSGVHASIHEAALTDYAAMVLDQRRPGVFKADLTPWSDGIRVKTRTPFKTPWRTIQIAPDAVGLLNSSLILNLNEANALGDVSWVRPGKYVGIWWAMHIRKRTWSSGPSHGATTAETERYMDFAARYGFAGVLVEGWNLGWDGDWVAHGDAFDFLHAYPDFDLRAVTDYARAKGVQLIGHHETAGFVSHYESQMKAAYDLYQSVGVHVVKTGYVADGGGIKRVDEHGLVHYEWHDGQYAIAHYLRSVQEAARRQISIITHEPIKDTGLRRTYPNWIAREGARGGEYDAWGDPPNPPEHTTILPFTRLLSGPMDYTPGIFDLTFQGPQSPQRVQTTLAKQLALYLVIYSPMQMAADLPENYVRHPDAFQFIRDVPTDWERSVGVAGEVGDYVAIARQRRGGADWYLGAVTDEQARDLALPLAFLDPRRRYVAQIYRDAEDADWRSNPYAMVIEERELGRDEVLTLTLAAGGGAAVRFQPREDTQQ